MFNSPVYHQWLDKRAEEILSKVDRETISTEEMNVLVLKEQSNNFIYIEKRFEKIDERFEKIDQRFIEMDKKIDSHFRWTIGLSLTLFSGLYIKLFFH